MAENLSLGQIVPKSPGLTEGLFLMDGIEGLRSLPRHSVDMLLTDPPYGTTRNFWDVPLPLPELWEAVKWAVKPEGAVLFFAQCPYDKVLGASNLSMLRYEWIWYKERGTGFLNANRAPLKKSENILVFYQKAPLYNPQFTYGKPYSRVHARSGTSPNYGKFERQSSESSDGRRYPCLPGAARRKGRSHRCNSAHPPQARRPFPGRAAAPIRILRKRPRTPRFPAKMPRCRRAACAPGSPRKCPCPRSF